MNPSSTKQLDRALWYTICICLVILVCLSFYRIKTFYAFVNLQSSTLRMEFHNNGTEEPIAYFGQGMTIVDGPSDTTGWSLTQISSIPLQFGVPSQSTIRLESLGRKPNIAEVCLRDALHHQVSRYIVAVRNKSGMSNEKKIDVKPEAEWCLDVQVNQDFIVFPRRLVLEPWKDIQGVVVYPDMSGNLRIRNTDRELPFISGMVLQLLLKEPPALEGKQATTIAFTDGQFGIHAWQNVQVLLSDSGPDNGKLFKYYFTPLDVLKKYAEDNGLWSSISLIIGIIFGIRQLLLLR